MIIILSSLVGATFCGMAMLVFALHAAPEGYEDENGFHRVR